MAGKMSAPAWRSVSMLRRWISESGVSRGTTTRRRRSLSVTSAARSIKLDEIPFAMRPSVPVEHGTIAMPAHGNDPLETGAARFMGSKRRTLPFPSPSFSITRSNAASFSRSVLPRLSPDSSCITFSPAVEITACTSWPALVSAASRRSAYGAPLPPVIPTAKTAMLNECVDRNQREQRDADDTVGGEEGGVHSGEISGFDEAVLVEQQQRRTHDTDVIPRSRRQQGTHGNQAKREDSVEERSEDEAGRHTEVGRDRVTSFAPVDLHGLARVNNVEARAPQTRAHTQQHRRRRHLSGNRQPHRGRDHEIDHPEHHVREGSEALGV